MRKNSLILDKIVELERNNNLTHRSRAEKKNTANKAKQELKRKQDLIKRMLVETQFLNELT